MEPPINRTTLTDDEFQRARDAVRDYLKAHPSIANREFRALTRLGYDQAIKFFRRMVETGELRRTGKASGIKYVVPGIESN